MLFWMRREVCEYRRWGSFLIVLVEVEFAACCGDTSEAVECLEKGPYFVFRYRLKTLSHFTIDEAFAMVSKDLPTLRRVVSPLQ